jgi:thioredoxin reductase (NADPH)
MFGGQIATTNDVENYPGFEEITGPDLTLRMRRQAEKFGAEIQIDTATEIDVQGPPFKITATSGEIIARSVIAATGATARQLGVAGEEHYWGRGVSFCATCDGAFFRDVPLAVIGGGDSALQEALFLTRFASKVTVVHRRDELRAGPYLRQRAQDDPKIEFLWNKVVESVEGNEVGVTHLCLRDTISGESGDLKVGGMFVFIGHFPNTALFEGKLETTREGYLVSDRRMHSSVEGIFVAGEAQDHYFRQAITGAGEGCMAAMEAEKFVAQLGGLGEVAVLADATVR